MLIIFKSNLFGDFRNFIFCLNQQTLCLRNADLLQIVHKIHTGMFFKRC